MLNKVDNIPRLSTNLWHPHCSHTGHKTAGQRAVSLTFMCFVMVLSTHPKHHFPKQPSLAHSCVLHGIIAPISIWGRHAGAIITSVRSFSGCHLEDSTDAYQGKLCALKRPVSQSFLYSLPDRLPSQRFAWNKSTFCGVMSLTSHYNQNLFHNDNLKLKLVCCQFKLYFTGVMT